MSANIGTCLQNTPRMMIMTYCVKSRLQTEAQKKQLYMCYQRFGTGTHGYGGANMRGALLSHESQEVVQILFLAPIKLLTSFTATGMLTSEEKFQNSGSRRMKPTPRFFYFCFFTKGYDNSTSIFHPIQHGFNIRTQICFSKLPLNINLYIDCDLIIGYRNIDCLSWGRTFA